MASLTSNSITVRWERGGEGRGGEERRGEERRGEGRWEVESKKRRGEEGKGEEERGGGGRRKTISKQHHYSNVTRSSVRKPSNVSMQLPLVHPTTYLGHCCPGLKVAAHHHYMRERRNMHTI